MVYSYRAVEIDDPALHISTWETPKHNVTSCRSLHSLMPFTQSFKTHKMRVTCGSGLRKYTECVGMTSTGKGSDPWK